MVKIHPHAAGKDLTKRQKSLLETAKLVRRQEILDSKQRAYALRTTVCIKYDKKHALDVSAQRERGKLADIIRNGSPSAAISAWQILRPQLIDRIRDGNVQSTRNASALYTELDAIMLGVTLLIPASSETLPQLLPMDVSIPSLTTSTQSRRSLTTNAATASASSSLTSSTQSRRSLTTNAATATASPSLTYTQQRPPRAISAVSASLLPSLTSAPLTRPLRFVSLFDGFGGALVALVLALIGAPHVSVEFVYAADKEKWKTQLAQAVCATASSIHNVTHLSAPHVADITNKSMYTPEFCANFGDVDLTVAGIPCISHTQEANGNKKVRGLRSPECKAIVDGFFNVISNVKTDCLVIECSAKLQADPFFQEDILDRLVLIGLSPCSMILEANNWLPINRLRLFIICFRHYKHYENFWGVAIPTSREISLSSIILPPGHIDLPIGCYDHVKQGNRASLSLAATAVSAMPLLKGKGHSIPGVFKRKQFKTLKRARQKIGSRRMRKVKRGVVPTLIKSSSGVLRLRDTIGTRSFCAVECGQLMGIPLMFVRAMLKIKSNSQVVQALGDGFAISCLRDLLKNALRACGWGI